MGGSEGRRVLEGVDGSRITHAVRHGLSRFNFHEPGDSTQSSHEPNEARRECSDDPMTETQLCYGVYWRRLDLGELHVTAHRDTWAVTICRIGNMRS